MAIRGNLKEASLPDVLQLLAMGKKTGCLSITHRASFGYIYFNKGRICYASVVNRRDRLGDMLVKSGALTQAQLDAALDAQTKRHDTPLGRLLVEQGAVTTAQLHEAVDVQIREAVYFLFTWHHGTFNFESEVAPEGQDQLVSINPESLLLEGARRVDEWSLIEKKIPSFDLIFAADHNRILKSDAELTDEQTCVLEQIDGMRDVQGMIDATGLVEFEVGKALLGLLNAGFIHRIGKTAPAPPVAANGRAEEHRNLGVAFFKTGMFEESLREFRRVIELRDDDTSARYYIGLVFARQAKWDEAAAALRECASRAGAKPVVFHNLAFVLEQQHRYDEARAALQTAIERGAAKDPRVRTSLGVVCLLTGDLAAADEALTGARSLFGAKAPTAAWFHFAGLAAALRGDAKRAASILGDGVAAYPHAATLHNNLAAVNERLGDYDAAYAAAERGLHEDAGVAHLHKNIGDLRYRAARYDEALEAYSRAARANPEIGPDTYLKLGNIRLRRMEREEALRCWERALELDPDNAIVRSNLESVRQAY